MSFAWGNARTARRQKADRTRKGTPQPDRAAGCRKSCPGAPRQPRPILQGQARALGDGNPQLALDQVEGRIDCLVHVVILVSAQTAGEDHLALFGG